VWIGELAMGFLLQSEKQALLSAQRRLLPYRIILARSELASDRTIHARCTKANLPCRWTFIIAALCGITGILVTYFFVPDLTGVDLADEDAKFMEYLAENGWEGETGEDVDNNFEEEGSKYKDVKDY
jgi:hypothetical protein